MDKLNTREVKHGNTDADKQEYLRQQITVCREVSFSTVKHRTGMETGLKMHSVERPWQVYFYPHPPTK